MEEAKGEADDDDEGSERREISATEMAKERAPPVAHEWAVGDIVSG